MADIPPEPEPVVEPPPPPLVAPDVGELTPEPAPVFVGERAVVIPPPPNVKQFAARARALIGAVDGGTWARQTAQWRRRAERWAADVETLPPRWRPPPGPVDEPE